MTKGELKTTIRFMIIAALFLSCYCLPATHVSPEIVKAEYEIKENDEYYYKIIFLRDTNATPIAYQFNGLVFSEGDEIKVTFVEVDPPHIVFRITTSNNQHEDFSIFANLFVLETDWAELTEEYEGLGFYVSQNPISWTLTFYINGIDESEGYLKARYTKNNGVLEFLEAYEYPPIEDFFDITHIGFERIQKRSLLWMLAFLAIIPIGGIIGVFVVRKRRRESIV